MNSFIEYILYELKHSLLLAMLCLLPVCLGVGVSWYIFQRKHKGEKRFPWKRVIGYLLLAGYLAVVLYATLVRFTGSFRREYNLHLFQAWLEAWNDFSVKSWGYVLLNVAMFVPLGMLLPMMWKPLRKWYRTVPLTFAFSLCLELVQFAAVRGICDVDDLFCNTLGGAFGYCCAMALLSLLREKGKRAKAFAAYFSLTMLPVLAVSGIFLAYACKEYGNLPDAPTYRHNTKHVTWSLACQLPETAGTAAVYRGDPLSTDQCDALAETMAEQAGLTVDMTTYYQDFAYYHFRPNGLLSLYYRDGSFSFRSGNAWAETGWADADRADLEKALQNYPVELPVQADFTCDGDGWHTFSVARYIDGAKMYDGTLMARYTASGKVEAVENHLCAYTYYKEARILSPEEAWQKIKAGYFQDGGYFEHTAPGEITATACFMDYRVDTKGFYQPVYVFTVESPTASYTCEIVIPALK